jgi:glycogen(starch) synthase
MFLSSEEEDPDEYPFPLTLRTKVSGAASALEGLPLNGN